MNEKNILKALAVVAIVTLGLFVSCSDNVVEEKLLEDKLVYATFDKRSRTLTESSYTQSFELTDVSEVYWTYEAKKSSGDKGGKSGVTTSQTAVKSSLEQGLDGTIGPFSQGKWDFDVYGYKTKTETEPGSGEEGTDYVTFKVESGGTTTTYYYTDKIYYGSATGVTLKSGTEKSPDPINVIIKIVTEGEGTFAITNSSEFHWKDDKGDNPDGVYLKLEAKTEDGNTEKTEYIALTATEVTDSSGNYYYKLSDDKSFTWAAGYWTVTCSIVKAASADDVYTDEYTYAESPELFVKVYAGQTTKLEAKVIEEDLAYAVIKPKIVDGIATTTVTAEVVANTATVLSSSLTPASAADDSLDTSKATKVTVPATVTEFKAAENATVTAALTVSATPIETANKTIVASNNGKAVNAIDLKAVVKTTTSSSGSESTTETNVEKFTDTDGYPVPVLVDTYIEAGLKSVQLYYTYADDYKDDATDEDLSAKAGETEYWNASALPADYDESTSSENLTVPDVSAGSATDGVCYYDSASGRIIFRTTHFSSFVVTAKTTVARNKTTGKIYTSLSEAISEATEGSTLTLLDDVTLDSEISLDKSLTLDMSFYTIKGENKVTLGDEVGLTVTDSTADQTTVFMSNAKVKVGATSDKTINGKYFPTLNSNAKSAIESASASDTVILLDDIDLASVASWTPIGAGTRSGSGIGTGTGFKGTFDGNGKTISNLKIDTTNLSLVETYCIGLFGVVDGGTVKNLTLKNVDVKAENCEQVGALVGLAINNATIKNVTVGSSDSGESSSVTGGGAGGIVGRITESGTISDCANYATVNGGTEGAGGIVLKAYYNTKNETIYITNCKNYGNVTGTSQCVGGIAGFVVSTEINSCYNKGTVSGKGYGAVAGIVGEIRNKGSVKNSGNTGTVSIADNAVTSGLGGIVGWIRYNSASGTNYSPVEISGNTNSGSITGTSTTGVGGIVGLLYDAAVITKNTNSTTEISAANMTAGIVGAYQNFTEGEQRTSSEPYYQEKGYAVSTISENESVILTRTEGKNVTDVAWDNTSGGIEIVNNTPSTNDNRKASVTNGCGNTTYYKTLKDAVDAAETVDKAGNGIEIKLLDTASLSGDVFVGKSTIDLNGKTLEVDGNGLQFGYCKYPEANVTIKNGNIELGSLENGNNSLFVYNGSLTLDDVKLSGGEGFEQGIYINNEGSATLNVKDSDLNFSSDIAIQFGNEDPGNVGSLTIEDSTITGIHCGLKIYCGETKITSSTIKYTATDGQWDACLDIYALGADVNIILEKAKLTHTKGTDGYDVGLENNEKRKTISITGTTYKTAQTDGKWKTAYNLYNLNVDYKPSITYLDNN